MSKLETVNYTERLNKLRELLGKVQRQQAEADFIDYITHELADLEEKIHSLSLDSSTTSSDGFSKKEKDMQAQLDATVRLYEELYDRTRKLLYEKQSRLDNERLLSAEELDQIRTEYAEKLLGENNKSIFLRHMIELERQVLAKYKEASVKAVKQSEKLDVEDIEIIHFSNPIVATDKFRKIKVGEDDIANMRQSVHVMPEKIVAVRPAVDYIPQAAPEDMVDNEENISAHSRPTEICCFREFYDELRHGDDLYNIVHATYGTYINVDALISTIEQPISITAEDSYSAVDRMLDSYQESADLLKDIEERTWSK